MSKPNFIVSANYRDRSSPLRWLLRSGGSEPVEASPFTALVANGVEFCPSSDYEEGFGCSIVAYCDGAQGFADNADVMIPDGAIRISFDKSWDRRDQCTLTTALVHESRSAS